MKLFGARKFFISLMITISFFLILQVSSSVLAAPQVSFTLNYSIIGGGTVTPPIITYISNGAQHSQTLSLKSTTYNLDLNTQWSITNPLSGSLPDERWQTNQNTAGTAVAKQNTTLKYYHQFQVQFSYNILNGGSGFLTTLRILYEFWFNNSKQNDCERLGGQWIPLLLCKSTTRVNTE